MNQVTIDRIQKKKYLLIKVSGPIGSGKSTMIAKMAARYEGQGFTVHKNYEGDEPNDDIITTPPSRTVVFLETITP